MEPSQEVEQLKAAITADDVARVQAMMTRNPALHTAPLGYHNNGPLTWAAECRGTLLTPERLEIARWMLAHGSDVHQGGDGPLMRAALSDDRIPMMELLVEHGADVNAMSDGHYPIILAPCEALQPRALRWLIARGADPNVAGKKYGKCVPMLVGTYSRNAEGKGECLEAFAEAGYSFPDTAPMAVHRARTDLLEQCLAREPNLLSRHFDDAEIYPAELGLARGDGLTFVSLDGATLLHMTVEFLSPRIAEWLLDHGAAVDSRAAVDAEGFGGQTPLFHTVVSPFRSGADLARLLLERGADPNIRATFRKQLSMNGDVKRERMREFHNVTPMEFAKQYQEQDWVNEGAIGVIREFGGA